MTALPDLSGVAHPPTWLLSPVRGGGRFAVPGTDLLYAAPYAAPPTPGSRTQRFVETTSPTLRDHLLPALASVRSLTGRDLPGLLPRGQVEPDPATSITPEGAS